MQKPGDQKIKFGVNATSSAHSFFGAVRKIEFYSPPSGSADKNQGALKFTGQVVFKREISEIHLHPLS